MDLDDPGSIGSLPGRPVPRCSADERLQEWVMWFGVGRLVAVAASVLAIGAGGYWLLRTPAAPVEASLPYASASPTTIAAETDAASTAPTGSVAVETSSPTGPIIVHVAGAVVGPGVYELAASARVVDAVDVAGGFAPDAHPDALNLAAPLHDGDRVYVPRIGEVDQVPAGVTGVIVDTGRPVGPVDLNTATVEDLDTLPGVGPATAQAIISHREQSGPFSSVDQLADVRGIGPAKLESLRGLVTV